MMMRALIAVLIMCCPMASRAQSTNEAPDCTTVASCVLIVRTYQIVEPARNARASSGIDPRPLENLIQRLVAFGDPAVVALLPLLDDPNANVRNRAAYVLFHFHEVDARHASRLIAARRAGVAWLHMPIARTGTEEALDFLWADFVADPDSGSNSQVFFALPVFGDRVYPRLEAALDSCVSNLNNPPCYSLYELLNRFEPYPAFAPQLLEAIAQSPSASDEARNGAIRQLVRLRHPYGLTALIEALQQRQRPPDDDDQFQDFALRSTIESIAAYGGEAARAGPLIAPFASARELADTRAAAVLALGQINYAPGADVILAQTADFDDDWYLAYNAAESLGRLGAGRRVLERLARSHWYGPVRYNAERALNLIDGGAFERGPDDGASPDHEEQWPLTGAEFRYAGDFGAAGYACTFGEHERAYDQHLVGELSWPRAGPNREIALQLGEPSDQQAIELHAAYPAFEDERPLMFTAAFAGHLVVGTSYGEWGGGVYSINRRGRVRRIIDDNAIAAFRSGRYLFVVTGLSHLVMSRGTLWVIDTQGGEPNVARRIRLPREPTQFEVAYRQTLVIGGTVAIRADGKLVDPEDVEGCR